MTATCCRTRSPFWRSTSMGIAERLRHRHRLSHYNLGDRLYFVNLAEHEDGRGVKDDLSLSAALSGQSQDPCVGKFLEFRIVRDPAKPDVSRVPTTLIPNPDLSTIPVVRERTFQFGRGARSTQFRPEHRLPRAVGHRNRRWKHARRRLRPRIRRTEVRHA